MKKLLLIPAIIFMLLTACSETNKNAVDAYSDLMYSNVDRDLEIEKDYEKVITKALVKYDDWKYIVEGTIEYRLGSEIIAVIDYGDGTYDDIATKVVDGEIHEFSLSKDYYEKYEKVLVEAVVFVENWNYPVSGIVEYYMKNELVATVDYGDGTLDALGTKTTKEGTTVFDMSKGK